MGTVKRSVSKTTKILFPLVVTVIGGLIAPMGLPLLGTIMLGNLMKESGAVRRLTKASENEIANIVTLLLGISIGATMDGRVFLKPQTLVILALGFDVFEEELDWLEACGTFVERFDPATDLSEVSRREPVKEMLAAEGDGCLPLILADGDIVSHGAYPSRTQLAHIVSGAARR